MRFISILRWTVLLYAWPTLSCYQLSFWMEQIVLVTMETSLHRGQRRGNIYRENTTKCRFIKWNIFYKKLIWKLHKTFFCWHKLLSIVLDLNSNFIFPKSIFSNYFPKKITSSSVTKFFPCKLTHQCNISSGHYNYLHVHGQTALRHP